MYLFRLSFMDDIATKLIILVMFVISWYIISKLFITVVFLEFDGRFLNESP